MAHINRAAGRRGARPATRGAKARPSTRNAAGRSTPKKKNSVTLERVKKAAVSAGHRAGIAAKRVVNRVKTSRRAQLATVAAAGMVAAAVGLMRKRGKKR